MATLPCILGYYADWAAGLTPRQIDYRLFTHLTHAFATVQSDGTLTMPDPAKSRDLCARAHAAGTKVLLAIGGAGSGKNFARATATLAGVARLVDGLAAVVRDTGYNGLDVDWESPTDAASQAGMETLIRALRERLPPDALITMAAPASDWSGRWFDRAALLPSVDLLNVMTYDFHGPWSDHAGHNAPLAYSPDDGHPACRTNTLDGALNYWLRQKGWPREKLLLGIPLYGRGFRASGWGAPATGSYARSEVMYRDIAALQKAGWKRGWDTAAQVPSLHSPDGSEILSYEDADSARGKGRYARDNDLGGIFFWEISQDFDGQTNPLVRAARAGLT